MANEYANVGGCVPVHRDEFGGECAIQSGGFCSPNAPTFLPVIHNLSEAELTADLQIETE